MIVSEPLGFPLSMAIAAGSRANYQLVLDADFAGLKSLVPRIGPTPTFTRASAGTWISAEEGLKTAATNEPRFDHDPTTGESLGLLLEPQRTNYNRNSLFAGTFGVSNPGSGEPTVKTYPEEEIPGYGVIKFLRSVKSVQDGSSGPALNPLPMGIGNPIFVTFFARKDYATSQSFRDSTSQENGQIRVAADAVDEWVHSNQMTHNTPYHTTEKGDPSLWATTQGVGTLDIALCQFEVGNFPTSHIISGSTATTRSADVCSIPWDGIWNPDEGTVFVDFSAPDRQSTFHVASAYYSGSSNFLGFYRVNDDSWQFRFGLGESMTRMYDTDTGYTPGARARIAYSYSATAVSASAAVNGTVAPGEMGTLSVPSVLRLLGRHHASGTENGGPYCGHIRRVRYYRRAMTGSQIQALTSL